MTQHDDFEQMPEGTIDELRIKLAVAKTLLAGERAMVVQSRESVARTIEMVDEIRSQFREVGSRPKPPPNDLFL